MFAQSAIRGAQKVIDASAVTAANSWDPNTLIRKSMEARSNEKQASIRASSTLKAEKNKIEAQVAISEARADMNLAKDKRDANFRKAGKIAAAGEMIAKGVAKKPDPAKPYVSNLTAWQDEITRLEGVLERQRQEIQGLETKGPMEVDTSMFGGALQQQDPGSVTGVSQKLSGGGLNPEGFNKVYSMAQQSGAKYPELVAAQWALESGHGASKSGKNNVLGVKAAANESGSTMPTQEYINGRMQTVPGTFKNYSSEQENVNEVVNRWHKNYGSYQGVSRAGTADDAAMLLNPGAEGYATDPDYGKKLINIMNNYGY